MLRWVVLFALAFWLSRLLGRAWRLSASPPLRPPAPPSASVAERPKGRLVACGGCGIWVEEGRAARDGRGGFWCSACRAKPRGEPGPR